MRTAAILALVTAASAEPPHLKEPEAPPVYIRCEPRERVLDVLTRKYGETRRMTGTIGKPGSPPRIIEIWAGASSWTVTETFVRGKNLVTCLRWSGHNVRFDVQGLPL